MDRLLILKSYLRSGVEWEGDAQIKKDLATLRRTRTQLAALMKSYRLEDALEPQHKLALQAAAAVLGEIDAAMTPLPAQIKREQAKLKAEREARKNAELDAAAAEAPWGTTEALTKAEALLLNEFSGSDARAWLAAHCNEKFVHPPMEWGRGPIDVERQGAQELRREVARRFAVLREANRWGTEPFSLENYGLWKQWKATVAQAVGRAMTGGMA